MSGQRDDGTFAENKAHHPARKVSRHILDRIAPHRVVVTQDFATRRDEYGIPTGDVIVAPIWVSRPYLTERGLGKKWDEVGRNLDPMARGEIETTSRDITQQGSKDPLLKTHHWRRVSEETWEPIPEATDNYPSLRKNYPGAPK